MRQAMETSSAAIMDLTRAVTLLVDTIRLQGHQPPPAVPVEPAVEDIQPGAIPGVAEAPAPNTGHGPLAAGVSLAAAGCQGGTARGAPMAEPGHKGAGPVAMGAAVTKHGSSGIAPKAAGGPMAMHRVPCAVPGVGGLHGSAWAHRPHSSGDPGSQQGYRPNKSGFEQCSMVAVV
ncbi:UNVERIFIED_CONTAM: hypothetical protein K2H54_002587 [Gekko kuhli]